MQGAQDGRANRALGVKVLAGDRGAKPSIRQSRGGADHVFSIRTTAFARSGATWRKIRHFCICHLAHIRAMCDCLAPNY
jgi:hypothetical protein